MGFILISGLTISLAGIVSAIMAFKWNSTLTKKYILRCRKCKSVCDSPYLNTSSNIKTAIIFELKIKCPICSEETIYEAVKVNKDSIFQ